MKVRNGFVTNSSSSSFIISVKTGKSAEDTTIEDLYYYLTASNPGIRTEYILQLAKDLTPMSYDDFEKYIKYKADSRANADASSIIRTISSATGGDIRDSYNSLKDYFYKIRYTEYKSELDSAKKNNAILYSVTYDHDGNGGYPYSNTMAKQVCPSLSELISSAGY